MIFRFQSKLATQDRIEAFIIGDPKTEKSAYGPWVDEYEAKFKIIVNTTAIDGVTFYQAPLYDAKKCAICLLVPVHKRDEPLPDIWTMGSDRYLICSQKFRDLVESVDNFPHQFMPMSIIDTQEQVIETQCRYYWFNPRRFLRINPTVPVPEGLPFFSIANEEDFLGRLLDDKKLERKIAGIPLWRHWAVEGFEGRISCARSVMYFNAEFVDKARNKNITGMDEYSAQFGLGEESLVKITSESGSQ